MGPPLIQITAVEFLYGVIFGLFFYKKKGRIYYINTFLCALVMTLIDITLVSYILTSVGYFPSFGAAVSIRLAASVIKFFMYIIVCVLLKNYINSLERMMNK